MFVPLAALALLPFALAGDCTREYTVKAGDTCDSISAANNVSTYQFATVNYDKVNRECTNLEIGQSYCLGTEGEDCTQTYVVQPGDYCTRIETAFGINSTILYANNPNIDQLCYTIYVGQVLCVAPTVIAPPPAGLDNAPTNTDIQTIPPPPEATPPANQPPADDEPADEEPADEEPADEEPAPPPPADEDEDDEDLPECEDEDDDGYY